MAGSQRGCRGVVVAVRRIGMPTLSSNTVVEPVTMRLAAPLADQLTVHFSRVPVTVISDDQHSHRQFEEAPLLAAARLLADAVAIHCTNLRGAEVAASLAEELEMPVLDSVVVAFWGALRCLGLAANLPGFGGRLRCVRQGA